MKKFTKYFGGDYMKYWYVAFAVILFTMFASMINDGSVKSYDLYIYNPDGTLKSVETVPAGYYEAEHNLLPVSKKFVPHKLF